MKFSFSAGAVTLSLSQLDIELLLKGSRLDLDFRFAAGDQQTLRFRVAASQKIEVLRAFLAEEELRLVMPLTMLEKWAYSSMNCFHFEQNIGGNERLKITVEKEDKDSLSLHSPSFSVSHQSQSTLTN